MNVSMAILSILTGYLFGSVSFSRLVARRISPQIDPQNISIKDEVTGAEHPRAVNASTLSIPLGWKAGCLIALLDMLKVALPTFMFKLLFPGQPYFLLVAVAGLVGNDWPIYYRFKGGTGISAIFGGLLVIDPLSILVSTAAGFLVGLIIMRSFAVMFILSLLGIIPWLWFRFHDLTYVYYGIAVNLIYLAMFVRDAKDYLRPGARVMGEKEIMAQMPMGRGMIRMIERLGLSMDSGLSNTAQNIFQRRKANDPAAEQHKQNDV
jgi:glycerol-3-phosphate acyltransferase PlsY